MTFDLDPSGKYLFTSGPTPVIDVPRLPIDDGGTIKPTVVADPDRRAAEWVLSIGGNVRIIENSKEGNPRAIGELPMGAFELRIVDFEQNAKLTDAGLAGLKDCKELTHLLLQGTQVSDLGLVHLKTCSNLNLLHLQKTKVTAAGIAEIKKALPNCKIEWDGGVVEPNQAAADPDRCAAEWVLSIGGTITINERECR